MLAHQPRLVLLQADWSGQGQPYSGPRRPLPASTQWAVSEMEAGGSQPPQISPGEKSSNRHPSLAARCERAHQNDIRDNGAQSQVSRQRGVSGRTVMFGGTTREQLEESSATQPGEKGGEQAGKTGGASTSKNASCCPAGRSGLFSPIWDPGPARHLSPWEQLPPTLPEEQKAPARDGGGGPPFPLPPGRVHLTAAHCPCSFSVPPVLGTWGLGKGDS